MSLKETITAAMKEAMRAKEKERLTTIRMLLSAIKQVEIDERIEVDDERAIAITQKLIKRGKDSLAQYQEAGREDLASKESADIAVLEDFMPQQLSADEIAAAVKDAIAESGAASMQDMGKVMKILKPQLQGRADMGAVSAIVRENL